MLCMDDSCLQQLKSYEQVFGGINIRNFSDLLQLPPVGENQVFDQPDKLVPASVLISFSFFNVINWKCEIMRLYSVYKCLECLASLRALFCCIIARNTSKDFTEDFAVENALRICITNN